MSAAALALAVAAPVPLASAAVPNPPQGCAGLPTAGTNPGQMVGVFCRRFQADDVSGAFNGTYVFDETKAFWKREITANTPTPPYSDKIDKDGITLKADAPGQLADESAIGYRLIPPATLSIAGVASRWATLLNDRAGQLPGVQVLAAPDTPVNTQGDGIVTSMFWDRTHPAAPPSTDNLQISQTRKDVSATITANDPTLGKALQYRLRTTCDAAPNNDGTQQTCPVGFNKGTPVDASDFENALATVERSDVLLHDLANPTATLTTATPNTGSCKAKKKRNGGGVVTNSPDNAVTVEWMTDPDCVRVSAEVADVGSGIASTTSSASKGPGFDSPGFKSPKCEAAKKLEDFGRECDHSVKDEADLKPPKAAGGAAWVSVAAKDQGGRGFGSDVLNKAWAFWDLKNPKVAVTASRQNGAGAKKSAKWLKFGDQVVVTAKTTDGESGAKSVELATTQVTGAKATASPATCGPRMASAPRCPDPAESRLTIRIGADDKPSTVDLVSQPSGNAIKLSAIGTDAAGRKKTEKETVANVDLLDPRITVAKPTLYANVDAQQIPRGKAEVDVTISRLSDAESGLASASVELLTRAGEVIGRRSLPSKRAGSYRLTFTIAKAESYRGGRVRVIAKDAASNESRVDRAYDVSKKSTKPKRPNPSSKKPKPKPTKLKPVKPEPPNTNVAFGISLGNPEVLASRDFDGLSENAGERRLRSLDFLQRSLGPELSALNPPAERGQLIVRYIAPIDSLVAPEDAIGQRSVNRLAAFADSLQTIQIPGVEVRGMISFMGHDFTPCAKVEVQPLDPAGPKPLASCSVPSVELYTQYLQAFAQWNGERAGGRIVAWGSWNEPNIDAFKLPALQYPGKIRVGTEGARLAGEYAAAAAQVFGMDRVVVAEFAGFTPDGSTKEALAVGGPEKGRKTRPTFKNQLAADLAAGRFTARRGLQPYIDGLGGESRVKDYKTWGVHNYGDLSPRSKETVNRSRVAEDFAAALRGRGILRGRNGPTQYWISETGVPLEVGDAAYAVNGSASLQYAGGALMRNFGARIPELRRILAYDIIQGPLGKDDGHDSAWLDRQGRPRYSYCGLLTGTSASAAEASLTPAQLAARCGGACTASAVSTPTEPPATTPFPPLPTKVCKP